VACAYIMKCCRWPESRRRNCEASISERNPEKPRLRKWRRAFLTIHSWELGPKAEVNRRIAPNIVTTQEEGPRSQSHNVMTIRHIYLDYNASTPVDPTVVAAMRPFFEGHYGNPSRGHWAATTAKAALETAPAPSSPMPMASSTWCSMNSTPIAAAKAPTSQCWCAASATASVAHRPAPRGNDHSRHCG
jgi:hypothetical protein